MADLFKNEPENVSFEFTELEDQIKPYYIDKGVRPKEIKIEQCNNDLKFEVNENDLKYQILPTEGMKFEPNVMDDNSKDAERNEKVWYLRGDALILHQVVVFLPTNCDIILAVFAYSKGFSSNLSKRV
uniref:Uncharacterized protein LOC114342811 n=1 Tax=Diabrotica virgifera virgifera TaxID=50390 RepID=A0A6P7GHZ2_DIAVI